MCRLIEQCHKYLNCVLPYAAQLTTVFARFASPSLVGAKGQYILQSGVYNQSFIMKFMGYNIENNKVFQSHPRDSSSREDENEKIEEDNEEAPPVNEGGQDVPHRLVFLLMSLTPSLWIPLLSTGGGVPLFLQSLSVGWISGWIALSPNFNLCKSISIIWLKISLNSTLTLRGCDFKLTTNPNSLKIFGQCFINNPLHLLSDPLYYLSNWSCISLLSLFACM